MPKTSLYINSNFIMLCPAAREFYGVVQFVYERLFHYLLIGVFCKMDLCGSWVCMTLIVRRMVYKDHFPRYCA